MGQKIQYKGIDEEYKALSAGRAGESPLKGLIAVSTSIVRFKAQKPEIHQKPPDFTLS